MATASIPETTTREFDSLTDDEMYARALASDASYNGRFFIGVLTTGNGVGRFQFESATVGGIPLPKSLLQEIVSYYSRTPGSPDGVNLDDPFNLPARIREIQVERGQAIIIQ